MFEETINKPFSRKKPLSPISEMNEFILNFFFVFFSLKSFQV